MAVALLFIHGVLVSVERVWEYEADAVLVVLTASRSLGEWCRMVGGRGGGVGDRGTLPGSSHRVCFYRVAGGQWHAVDGVLCGRADVRVRRVSGGWCACGCRACICACCVRVVAVVTVSPAWWRVVVVLAQVARVCHNSLGVGGVGAVK